MDVEASFSNLANADEAIVDHWELIASRRALPNLATLLRTNDEYRPLVAQIDTIDWNSLTAARKALLDLKTSLYGEPLEALLARQAEQANPANPH